MTRTCSADCYPICDFCVYHREPAKSADGAYVTETGWCQFHDEPRDLTDDCEHFHCFTLRDVPLERPIAHPNWRS